MSSDPDQQNPDLESFREQWRAEVQARRQHHDAPLASAASASAASGGGGGGGGGSITAPTTTPTTTAAAGPSTIVPGGSSGGSSSAAGGSAVGPGLANAPRRPPPPPSKGKGKGKGKSVATAAAAAPGPAGAGVGSAAQDGGDGGGEDDYYVQPRTFDHDPTSARTGTGFSQVGSGSGSAASKKTEKEPVTALEHYEKAVEREVAGKLGDSLSLYRKAFRMDDSVDQKYKSKHFPKPPPKPISSSSAQGGAAVGDKAAGADQGAQPQTLHDLIASFAGLTIEPAGPPIEGMPPPPCPIAALPEELLVHILRDVAILDVGDFARLAQVCRRLAYLVATEDRIWRRICLGSEFGFGGMHYHWQKQVAWGPLTTEDLREAEEDEPDSAADSNDTTIPPPLTLKQRTQRHAAESAASTLGFYRSLYGASWQRMFRFRPRIRFNGCYISTVNYIRAGMHNSNSITWGSPVHIVTYYRYLRFFRDGTAISLLTTAEPADVVHHLTRDAVALHAGGAQPHLPSSVMQFALRGRWRLARAADNPHACLSEMEGDLVVETEGVSKYIYRLDLSFRSAGSSKTTTTSSITGGGAGGGGSLSGTTKNNKLIWRGFYSYNRLTDDWAEFALKNDKPYFFSRVKSYGVTGE